MAVELVVILVLLVAAVAASSRFRSESGGDLSGGERNNIALPWSAQRIFMYTLSLAGLVATLVGIAELAAIIIARLTLRAGYLMSAADEKGLVSYYLASLVVGAPVWLGLWMVAQRQVKRSPKERGARERRLYLAAVFGVASVVALFGLHTVLRVLLTLPNAHDPSPTVRDGIYAGFRLLVWGAVWLVYARIGWRERRPRERDEAHDLAAFSLTGFALVFLVIGLYGALRHLIGVTIASPAGDAPTWAESLAWILAGGLTWGVTQRYDVARGGHRPTRVLYLYTVLLVGVPVALFGGIIGLTDLLRNIFGYVDSAGTWHSLQDALPPLLIGGAVWAYHWAVMRRQATLSGDTAAARGGIPWPRRLGIVLLTLGGLAIGVGTLTSLAWLALDWILNQGVALSGGSWWRDRLSAGLAAGVVGTAIWLMGWVVMQRAAAADPLHERTAQERRRMLGLVGLAGILIALGFIVALLWTVFHALLAGSTDASTGSRLLKDVSAALIALAVAAYHGAILRSDLRLHPSRPRRLRVTALVAPGGEGLLTELDRPEGRTVELLGRLAGPIQAVDLPALESSLAALEGKGATDGALLILTAEGITVYPYARSVPAPTPKPREGALQGPALAAAETG